jgi:hypothetical protein
VRCRRRSPCPHGNADSLAPLMPGSQRLLALHGADPGLGLPGFKAQAQLLHAAAAQAGQQGVARLLFLLKQA